MKGDAVCKGGECDKATCCAEVVTTVTTTPPAKTTPADPCAPSVVARKYDAKEMFLAREDKNKGHDNSTPAWAFPLFGAFAMFSLAALVAAGVRERRRTTRQFRAVAAEPDDRRFFREDSPIE